METSEGYDEAKRRIRQALEENAEALYLDGLGLSDLPSELAELISVRLLVLEFNDFETLPEVILRLPQLEGIYMERNPIQHLPDWISELRQLQGLNFYECQLRDVPDSIGELVNLDHFALDGNQLKTLPESFGNLAKLESVGLSNNQFETLPATFGNLANLDSLSLGWNQLRELPGSIVQLEKLDLLDLDVNKLVRLPKDFHKLSNLKALIISDNPITALPEGLPPLEVLEIIRCYHITELPQTLTVTGTLRLGGQKLTSLPNGCKDAKLKWYSAEIIERFLIHPETITAEDVLSAENHFTREALFDFMEYTQLLREVDLQILDEAEREKDILRLAKIEIPNGEAESYLITVDKSNKTHTAQWVLSKFQTCQEAFNWLNRQWEDK
jgi:hypothetical protein